MPFPAHPSRACREALGAQGYLEPTPVQARAGRRADTATCWSPPRPARARPWPSAWPLAAPLLGEAERFERAEAPLRPDHRADPRTGHADQPRVRPGSTPTPARGSSPASAAWTRAREQRALAAGAHIVVGTPGRLRDHLERGNLDLSALKVAVLDEADEMLDIGFREDLEEILDATPPERRTLLFSATIATDIATLAKSYQTRRRAHRHRSSATEPHGDIDYRAIRVAPERHRERGRQRAALLRSRRRAGLLRHPRARAPPARRPARARLRRRRPVRRADAEGAQRRAAGRCATAMPRSASPPTSPPAASTCPTSAWSSTPTCRPTRPALLHRSRPHRPRRASKGTSVLLVALHPAPPQGRAACCASANIDADWTGPPTAEEIRAKDQARMLEDPMLTEDAARRGDSALAERLLADRSAEAGGRRPDPPVPLAPAGARGHVRRRPRPRAPARGQRARASAASARPSAWSAARVPTAWRRQRRDLVPPAGRPLEERRPEVAGPADLPPGPRRPRRTSASSGSSTTRPSSRSPAKSRPRFLDAITGGRRRRRDPHQSVQLRRAPRRRRAPIAAWVRGLRVGPAVVPVRVARVSARVAPSPVATSRAAPDPTAPAAMIRPRGPNRRANG